MQEVLKYLQSQSQKFIYFFFIFFTYFEGNSRLHPVSHIFLLEFWHQNSSGQINNSMI